MKVSPQSSPLTATEQEDGPRHHSDDSDAANNCGSKRRRLHSQTNTIDNHLRHRKHVYPRHDNKSTTSTGCFDDSNSSCSSGNGGGDASDCDDSSNVPAANSHPVKQRPAEEGTSSPPPPPSRHNKKIAVINNNNNVNDGNKTNKSTLEPTMSSNPVKSTTTINENYPTATDTDFDHTVTANDHVVNSETSNCLSQSPLNLTRSQGSSEEDGKSDYDDDDEYDDDNEEKINFDNVINDGENNIINGHHLPTAEAPFPWNITLGNHNNNNNDNNKNNKNNNNNSNNSNNSNNNKRHQNDKITVPSTSPPQLLLTSGHLTTGCLQAAQLLIPTARGIMTQTILAIPINDMVSSEITASNSTQRQLLHHSLNNVSQKNINRQQLSRTYCQPQLPLNRYFQHQTTDDETAQMPNASVNGNNDDTMTRSGMAVDNQRRQWPHADLNSKKHNFVSPQQKQSLRTKNVEVGDEPTSVQRLKDSSVVHSPAGANGDNRIYSNGTFGYGECNSNADIVQRQTAWPTSLANASDQNVSDEMNENGGKLYSEDKQQTQHSHGMTTSSANINTLKSLAPSSSQLNCPLKESKYDSTAAAAYSQQNAICTALATHMMCASQLAQQPMFDNLDNGNAVKKPNHYNNNNNNDNNNDNDNDNENNVKASNSIMGVVNPAVLEKWMMEERYYYNNSKNIAAGGHGQNQRYNSTVSAVAVAAAAAVELLNVSTSPSGDGLAASCKKRKRRTSFTPQALELLNGHFERNTHPSGSEITGLAHRLGYEREVIRIWFCNKRQALKNTVRSINGSTHNMTTTKSHNNTSGY